VSSVAIQRWADNSSFPIAGEATVFGGDGAPYELRVGQAALWEAEEAHETRSALGLSAIVFEGNLDI